VSNSLTDDNLICVGLVRAVVDGVRNAVPVLVVVVVADVAERVLVVIGLKLMWIMCDLGTMF
jgi:hypothetical protein